MIRVAGAVQRSFVFPAERPLAYAYYADIGRVLSYLPHICLVHTYGPDRLRLLYHSTELGIYRIRIFADVHTILEDGCVLHVRPMDSLPPVQAQSSADSTTSQGYFTSRSIFHDMGDQTSIEYELQLRANLPTPRSLRLMPGSVVNSIARGITHLRIHEIVEGFIERSVEAFPDWLEELRDYGSLVERGSTGSSALRSPDCPEEPL